MALSVAVVGVLSLSVKGPIFRLCFFKCYPEKARTRSNIIHVVSSRVKYIEMYLNINTLEGFKCKYNYKYF